MPNIEFLCLKALKYVNVIQNIPPYKYIHRTILTIAGLHSISKFGQCSKTKFDTNLRCENFRSPLGTPVGGRLTVEPATFPKGRSNQAELLPVNQNTILAGRHPICKLQ